MNSVSWRVILCFLVVLFPTSGFACLCSPVQDFKTVADLKNYDFIALAEVTGLADPVEPGDPYFRKSGDVRIRILELFKGEPVEHLNEPSVNSSCDLGLETGEQWLFFSSKDTSGRMLVGPCSHTVLYRDSDGLRDWQFFRGMQQLLLLRTIFDKPVTTGPERTIRYASGRTEVEQNFRNGKLHSLRKIYYPTGELYIAEKFRRGKRAGYRKVFEKSGQLFRHTTYRRGYKRRWISYFKTGEIEGLLHFEARRRLGKDVDAPEEPDIKRVFDSLSARVQPHQVDQTREFERDWRSYQVRRYFPDGILQEEADLKWPDKSYTRKVYDETGVIRYKTTLDGKSGSEINEEFDAEGSARKRIGTCTSCDIYFNPSFSDAIPEPMIIP